MGAAQNYVGVTRRQPDVEDYIDMLRRYRSWVIAPTFAGLVIAVVVAFCWPDTYESHAVMRIVPQAISPNLVEGVTTTSMAERLNQMELQILGRTSLMDIIQKPALNLYQKERAHVTLDEVAERMRTRDVHVRLYDAPGASSATRGAQAFMISYLYTDRFKAQAVVREITGLFADYNYKLQEGEAKTEADFLLDELRKAKDRVDAADQAVQVFAAQHQGELPQDAMMSTTMVNNKDQAIHAEEDLIARLGGEKLDEETQLQNLQIEEGTTAANVEQTVTTPATTLNNERILQYDKMIEEAKQRLKNLQTQYQDDYPDVVSAKNYVDSLVQQRAEIEKSAPASPAQAGPETRTVQNLAAAAHLRQLQESEKTVRQKIANLDAESARQTKHLSQLQSELQALQLKVASSPAVVQQYTELVAEQSRAKEAYDQKSRARDQSETAQNLENHHAGESLETLETADLPETPAEPNRWAIVGLGTLVGVLAGFGLAGAKELKDTSLKNLKDVRAYTNLPVLTSVPLLENALLVRRKRRLAWLAWSSALVIGGFLMCGAAYYHFAGLAGAG